MLVAFISLTDYRFKNKSVLTICLVKNTAILRASFNISLKLVTIQNHTFSSHQCLKRYIFVKKNKPGNRKSFYFALQTKLYLLAKNSSLAKFQESLT